MKYLFEMRAIDYEMGFKPNINRAPELQVLAQNVEHAKRVVDAIYGEVPRRYKRTYWINKVTVCLDETVMALEEKCNEVVQLEKELEQLRLNQRTDNPPSDPLQPLDDRITPPGVAEARRILNSLIEKSESIKERRNLDLPTIEKDIKQAIEALT